MKYCIAIPSYQRADQLKEKTLDVLWAHDIDPSIVTIFVANEDEYKKYSEMLATTHYKDSKLVIGVKGIGAIRNFIINYYPEGTRVFHMDDDIKDVLCKIDDKTMVPCQNLEFDVIIAGFRELEKHNANLFGIYAAANAMFMKHKVSVGLYYCIGSMWGNIIRHDPDLMVTMNDKEDYERTLQYYVKDGKVVRLDNITVKTKYYGIGGMQEERTEATISEGARILTERYPELCTSYVRETTGHAELRLRDRRPVKGAATNNLEAFFDV